LGHGLGHFHGADECHREEQQQDGVRNHARGGKQVDDDGRGQHAETHAGRAGDPVRQADGTRIATWMQVKERGTRGPQREPRRQPLHGPRGKQPDHRAGDHEQDGCAHQRGESDEQHWAPPDVVRDGGGEQEGRQYAEGVRPAPGRSRRAVPGSAPGPHALSEA
jgi:hypothetical protein